ncbi:hypothetical protein R1sor_008603 [Riccia sorocarpa]|uniref:AIR9-like A9 domain-containing protein n=1 Tax=Riccia sorocarpa TaxID=122646 RepID=A0ABD3HTW8_9MARC
MAFAATTPELGVPFGETRLSKVAGSSLFKRRHARPAIDDKPFSPPSDSRLSGDIPGETDLSEKIGALELTQPPANSSLVPGNRQVKELVQVIEAAESALRNQMEENEQLRSALRVTEWELQNSKMEQLGGAAALQDRPHEIYLPREGVPRLGGISPADRHGHRPSSGRGLNGRDGQSAGGIHEEQQSSVIVHPTAAQPVNYTNGLTHNSPPNGTGGMQVSNGSAIAGVSKSYHRGIPHLSPMVDTNSNVSSPSSRSLSPGQRRRESELDARNQQGAPALSQHPGTMNGNHNAYSPHSQQELAVRTMRSLEEENLILHRRLTEAAIKEAQVLSEKRILERRVAELRLAYDQQQQGLVDAASKALSYRQDVLEENIRLTYALQAADNERSVYVSMLLPLLSEFDLQPSTHDAHSMVSAVKILVQHLRSELSLSEMQGKSRDPLFRQPWRGDPSYHAAGQYPQQSPPRGKLHGMEIVPQPYVHQQMPSSPPSPLHHGNNNWDSGASPHQGNDQGPAGQEPAVTSGSPRGNNVQQSADGDEGSANASALKKEIDGSDPRPRSPRSPHMPTVVEGEPGSEDGDPLPAIEGLQIVGQAVLGGRLTACGRSINGTALCMFQWVRHYQNGTTKYIEGAAQPEYTVTADDCETLIAIECVPMDERNRRGELVTVFANDSRWISCDAMAQDQIDGYVTSGHATFDIRLLVDGAPPDDVSLSLKRSSYELRRLKSDGVSRRVVFSDKYSPDVLVEIPVGQLLQCVITLQEGRSYFLEFRDNRTRDVGVLTFRQFQKMALDGKRGKRRGGLPWFS